MDALLFWLSIACLQIPAQQDQQPPRSQFEVDLEGTWRKDPSDRGLVAVKFARKGPIWMAHVWGDCDPSPCNRGERKLSLLSKPARMPDPDRGLAIWDWHYATAYLVFRIQAGELIVESYTVFKEPDRRWPIHSENRLRPSTP